MHTGKYDVSYLSHSGATTILLYASRFIAHHTEHTCTHMENSEPERLLRYMFRAFGGYQINLLLENILKLSYLKLAFYRDGNNVQEK